MDEKVDVGICWLHMYMSMGVKAHQAKVIYINNVRQNITKSIQSDECTVTGLESCIIFPFRRSILLIVHRGYDTNHLCLIVCVVTVFL